jgi:hypothetical protein
VNNCVDKSGLLYVVNYMICSRLALGGWELSLHRTGQLVLLGSTWFVVGGPRMIAGSLTRPCPGKAVGKPTMVVVQVQGAPSDETSKKQARNISAKRRPGVE